MMDNFGSQGVYRSLAEHRAAYRAYHRIVCVSQQTKRRFVERFGFDTGVTVAYNVCDVARVRRLSLADCPDAPPRGGRRLLVVANLRPEKRLPMLVELLGALRDEGLDFCLDIVGDGPERGAIERAVARADLADRVRLLGHRGNPYPYMRQSELLVIASSAEGYSTVAREARLLGLPVLSTDCGGISELRGDDDGVTVVENHADALKNALRAALTRIDEQVGVEEQIAADKEKSASCEVQRIEFLLDEQGGEQHVFF
jgi:glycosyltransferase involved in cell wall biosynthesis